MNNIEEFKKLLRDIRISKKITQKELAKRIGITPMYIHTLENVNTKQLPSDTVIRKIAKALADNEKEEMELTQKLLFEKAMTKFPDETKEIIDQEKIKQHIYTDCMPVEFVERVKKDIQNKNISKICKLANIDENIFNAMLQYKGILLRREVISLARVLKESIYEYLILANFIPDNVKSTLSYKKVVALFRSIEDLNNEDVEELIDGIIKIIEAYKKKIKK